ncbi:helix-turn-helix domain-containing protein [Streptacidiphilus griseoplanus]|uniref:helix-turn-helix domain-containing protein n=1 Tax=Peterkaempfera griseoplana TaxID=66896 RepID=UPI0007C7C0D4|nr:helix-turn-helix domain-containing protein [Peterkaempfera griseoplana]
MGAPGYAEDLDELLRVVRRQGSLGEVLRWLGQRIGAEAAWLGGSGTVRAATPGFPGAVLGALDGQLARLAQGRLAAATAQVGGVEVRLEAFAGREPRPVLVTVSPEELTREAAQLASRTGGLVELLGRASEADGSSRGYEQKARQVRFAVLTALMAGDTTLARRMTTGDVPPLLSAEKARVYLLHCPPADRDRLVRAYQDPSGYHGPDLMVHCPAFDEHLICPVAEDSGAGGQLGRGAVLRRLVRENAAYALGVSRPYPLDATARAYGEALHALAVARNSPQRLASYRGQPSLVHLLPGRAALAWARAYVEPLDTVPRLTRDITRLAVTFPRSAVARLLQISRNTVAAHCRRAEAALGVDLGEVRVRAALDLALSLVGAHSGSLVPADDPGDPGDAGKAVPTLEELLRTRPAREWAELLLKPLRDDERQQLYLTVRAWIEAGADAQRTAGQLGLSRNTVRAHLRAVEGLLQRDLLTTGSGIHDLVHAVRAVTGHRAQPDAEAEQRARWPGRYAGF